ncbi:MAG: hypothetical protein L3J75_08665 [Methylococcaceae bacterium]|nr:hypothetical protein [Methylococcaceae bacterium]
MLKGEIAKRLGWQSNDRIFTELAIQTSMGVWVPDVSWGTDEYVKLHIGEVFASSAPEICVDIISLSNTQEEMLGKVKLFLRLEQKKYG